MADVGYLLNEADEAVANRQWDVAVEKLQKVLQLDPQNEEACERLAKCFAVRGLLTQVVNQYFMLMDILESKGDFDLSVEVGNWILKLQPENDKARMRMILVHRRKGDTAEVVRQSLALARVYMELNQGDQSILLLQEVSQNDPNNLEIGMELAEMYINQGLIQEGAMQLGKIANMLLEQGQLEKAADAFRRMKLVSAEDPNLSFTLGNIYVSLGKLNEAEAEFRQILRHNLNHLDALTALGGVCQQKGQFRDAMLAFNKILTIDPQQVIAKEKLGELYHAQGNLNESIKQYLAAAQQYQAAGAGPRAVTLYQRVVSLDPANATACRELQSMGAPLEGRPEEPAPTNPFPQPPASISAPTVPDLPYAGAGAPPSRHMPTPGQMAPMSPPEATIPIAPPAPPTSYPPEVMAPPEPESGYMQLPQAPVAHHDPYAPFNQPPPAQYNQPGPSFNQPPPPPPPSAHGFMPQFDAVTTSMPPLDVATFNEAVAPPPPAAPGPSNYWDQPAPAAAPEAPPSPVARDMTPKGDNPRGLPRKELGGRKGASSSLVKRTGGGGLESKGGGKSARGDAPGSKQLVKRALGSSPDTEAPSAGGRPTMPDRSEKSAPDSGKLSNVPSLLQTPATEHMPAGPWTPGLEPPPPPGPDYSQHYAPTPDFHNGPPMPPMPEEYAPPMALAPPAPFNASPPPPPGGFDSFESIPGPPSMETDNEGTSFVAAQAAARSLEMQAPAPPPSPMDFNSGMADYHALPPLTQLDAPPLLDSDASLPLAMPPPPAIDSPSGGLPWEAPPPALALAPPAPTLAPPGPPAPMVAPPQTLPTPLSASPTRRLLSESLAAELHAAAREVEHPPAPSLPPPMHAPPTKTLAEAKPHLVPPAAPSPNLAAPAPVDPGMLPASQQAPAERATAVPATPESAVDVTRLHDYIANNDLSRAFAAFNKGLESAPQNRELRQHLAQTYFQNGMLDEALGEFESLVEADPQNLRYRQQLAESALWGSELPRSVSSMIGYASCLQKEGSYDEAVAVLEDCIALDPIGSAARLALSDLHNQLNQSNLAMYHLNTAADLAYRLEDSEATIATLRRLHTMTGDPSYQQRLASALSRFGQTGEASTQYRDMARAARVQGDIHTALSSWQQVIQLQPEHEEALENLVEIYRTLQDGENYLNTLATLARVSRQQGQFDKARTLLEAVINADGRRMDMRQELVELHLQSGQFDSALHEAQHLIEAAMQKRDYAAAIALMQRLSEASPENLPLREQIINVYELMGDTEHVLKERIALGEVYSTRGQVEDAMRTYEKALAIDENNVEINYLVGCMLADVRQDLPAALARFERVFELDPQHTESMKRLIGGLMQRDEAARAVGVLNRLIELAPENKQLREQFLAEYQRKVDSTPDDLKSRFTLGVLYLELNQHDKAIEQFQKTRPVKEYTLKSYTMLGLAFSRKAGYNSDDLAIKQFKKGLEVAAQSQNSEADVNELRFHLAGLLDRKGRLGEAMDIYKDIYADDVNYHNGDVARRMKQIQEETGAGG